MGSFGFYGRRGSRAKLLSFLEQGAAQHGGAFYGGYLRPVLIGLTQGINSPFYLLLSFRLARGRIAGSCGNPDLSGEARMLYVNLRVKHIWSLVVGLAVVTVIGCSAPSGQGLVQTTGRIMYKGKPLEKAAVTLVPVDPGQRAAVGITDAQGQFVLVTPSLGNGVMPGKYKITVVEASPAVSPGEETVPEPDITKEGELQPAAEKSKTIPLKYAKAETTPLSCEIPKVGPHDLGVLELTD